MGALLAFEEKRKIELLDGKIVAMSPSPSINHTIAMDNICRILGVFLEGKTCKVFSDSVDVHLTPEDTVIPDVTVVCNKSKIKGDGIYGAPDLVVEVLSPGTAKNDRGYKKELYEKCGIKEYWIVDSVSCFIEVYLLEENKLVLDEIYAIFPDYIMKKMTDEEKDSIKHEFSPSLFPELKISVEKVFGGLV